MPSEARGQEKGEAVEGRYAFSIEEFCKGHGISRATYFAQRRLGLGPREMRVGKRVLISLEAAADWRRDREIANA